jgi:hypothetical protein
VRAALQPGSEDVQRGQEAMRFVWRYVAKRRTRPETAPWLLPEELAADAETARDLLASPPPSGPAAGWDALAAAAAAALQADILRGIRLPGDRAEFVVSTLPRISEAEGQAAGRSPTAVTSLQPGASPWVSRRGRHPALTHPAIGAAGFPAGIYPPPASRRNSASSACPW